MANYIIRRHHFDYATATAISATLAFRFAQKSRLDHWRSVGDSICAPSNLCTVDCPASNSIGAISKPTRRLSGRASTA